jgi:gamma-glutamyltranspeptidase / glutathione hydrolase
MGLEMMNSFLLTLLFAFAADQDYRKGLVVCVEPNAAEVGKAVLQQGGNAIDAAVATAFALAVTHPEAGNIGGGGFIVARDGRTKEVFTVDFREMAPKAATPTMFLDSQGNIDRGKSGFGWLVVGVPGSPMGLWTAHQKAGNLPWKTVVDPAVKLATDGFSLDDYLVQALNRNAKRFRSYGGDGGKLFAPEKPFTKDAIWKQPDLAHTLELIRDHGSDGFYRGETAAKIEAAMKQFGGVVTQEDLANYKAIVRAPVRGTYRGYEIVSMPPPSGGGAALIEMLNILDGFPLPSMKPDDPMRFHLSAEAMKRAFADRARFLGDSDFAPAPVELLTSKQHATAQRSNISFERATPADTVGADLLTIPAAEGEHTTHFSVADGEGGMVACTTTLEDAFGSHCVAPGTGFLLNNEMHDFNLKPGLTDRKGNVGTPANNIAPGKRMLSSMTPTLVFKDGKPFLVLGSPGGRTIINTVLMTATNVIDHQMDVQSAVDFGRIHHQWMPDELKIEAHLPASLDETLKKMGHKVAERKPNAPFKQGDCHAILIDPQTGAFKPGVDRRLRGAAVGY